MENENADDFVHLGDINDTLRSKAIGDNTHTHTHTYYAKPDASKHRGKETSAPGNSVINY